MNAENLKISKDEFGLWKLRMVAGEKTREIDLVEKGRRLGEGVRGESRKGSKSS